MARPDLVAAALARIEAYAYAHNNADMTMRGAAENYANGCAAFWHRAGGSNAVVGSFMHLLNETQDVLRACGKYEATMHSPCRMRQIEFLDFLIPLNRAAADSLGEAYEEVSTFRTANELMDRAASLFLPMEAALEGAA